MSPASILDLLHGALVRVGEFGQSLLRQPARHPLAVEMRTLDPLTKSTERYTPGRPHPATRPAVRQSGLARE